MKIKKKLMKQKEEIQYPDSYSRTLMIRIGNLRFKVEFYERTKINVLLFKIILTVELCKQILILFINIERCWIAYSIVEHQQWTVGHQNPDCSDFDCLDIVGQLFRAAIIWMANANGWIIFKKNVEWYEKKCQVPNFQNL